MEMNTHDSKKNKGSTLISQNLVKLDPKNKSKMWKLISNDLENIG